MQRAAAQLHALERTRVLSLDAHGRILDWMSWQDAVCLYVREAVAWTLGQPCAVVWMIFMSAGDFIEHLILSNRNILADQMEFLRSHLPKRSPRAQVN